MINWSNNENFHKKNFERFIGEVVNQAEKIQTEQITASHFVNSRDKDTSRNQKGSFPLSRKERSINEVPTIKSDVPRNPEAFVRAAKTKKRKF